MNRIILFLICLNLLISCSSAPRQSEQEILSDAIPPLDYDPTLISNVQPFEKIQLTEPELIISSVDTKKPDLIDFRLHFTEADTILLTDIDPSMFCYYAVVFEGDTIESGKLDFNEVNYDNIGMKSIVLAMDHSGSMGEDRAVFVQKVVKKIIENMGPKVEFALLRYDGKVSKISNLSGDRQELAMKHKINGLQGFGGMTAIADAIDESVEILAKSGNPVKAVVIFTDGIDNSSKTSPDSVIAKAISADTDICAFDFGENTDKNYLRYFTENTGGIYNHIYATEEIAAALRDLHFRLNYFYEFKYQPENFGKHKIYFKICLPDTAISASAEFDNTPKPGVISLLRINFDFNKAKIKKEFEPVVKSVYSLLESHPEMEIEIRGHTDSLNRTGDPDYNRKLSQKRADAVRDFLIGLGIAPNRIKSIGYGARFPIAENSTSEGRSINRRTEFVVLE